MIGPCGRHGPSSSKSGADVNPRTQHCRGIALAALILASLSPLLAAAQAPAACGSGAPETWFAACGAIIDDAGKSAAERARALKYRGVASYQRGDLERATADFTAATELAPGDSEAWSDLGMMRQARGDFDAAIADYEKAIALDPTSWVPHVNRADALRLKRDPAAAIVEYDLALSLKPDLAAALRGRSLAHQMRGDLNGAIADASAALKIDPRDGEALMGRGNAYRFRGENDKALADYEEATRVAPQQPNAWLNRGALLMETGRLDAAIESFDKVIALNPRSVEAYNNRGAAASQKGDFARAAADLEEAIRLGPNYEEAYGNRAFVRLAVGDFAGAAADFDRLVQRGPQDPYRILWRHIARMRAGEADADFAFDAGPHLSGPWPAPVLAFYLGSLAREKVMELGPDVDPADREGRRCEQAFYLGEHALASNDRAAAVSLMREAAEGCPLGFLERVAALGELRRLQP
jgi:lipoprotein NlpI